MRPSSIPLPRNIQFRVETMFPNNRVGRVKPDERGVYCGMPLMVLGEITQQKTFYDPQSVVHQITDKSTRLNKVVSQGKLYGEYGHPQFYETMTDNDKIQRLMTVDESKQSHLFTSIYTDKPSADGTIVIRGDIKPTGPYGAILKESLDDPIVNTAFSLRAYVSTDVKPDGLKYRTVRSLTTWDTVNASGYAGTDKAHAIGLESFGGDDYLDYEINVMQDGNIVIDQIALESYSDTELNEIFGSTKVSKLVQSRTFVKADPELHEKFPNLYKNGIFNEYFKEV